MEIISKSCRLWPRWAWPLPLFLCLFSAFAADPRAPLAPNAPRARVVIAEDPAALSAFNPVPEKVRSLVSRGIVHLTGKPSANAAWLSLVSTQDVVGIKVFSLPGANSGTRPAVVEAVVEGLLAAGIAPEKIVLWDRQLASLRTAGYDSLARRHGIRLAASLDAGYDEKVYYDTAFLGHLVWGDLEFGQKGDGIGRKSFVTKLLVTDITKIINLTPLLNHNEAGVSGNLYSLASGSVDNFMRFDSDGERLATAVPEICALKEVGDRVVLNIVDALICQYQGEQRGLLHYSAPLGQLRFSTDPVALDVLSLGELARQRNLSKTPDLKKKYDDLYRNASLVELGVSDLRQIRIDKAP